MKGNLVTRGLEIELRLPKMPVATTDPIDVEVVFRNIGNEELKIPLMSSDDIQILFFDFVFVGPQGGREITRRHHWGDPMEKPVQMIRLAPGASRTVKVPNAFKGNMLENQVGSWAMLAIYQDHSYGHSSTCLLYTSPSPRDLSTSRMPSSA